MRARLVELDERNVTLARQAAGLPGIEVLQAGAGITDACAGEPAPLALGQRLFTFGGTGPGPS